MSHQDLVVDAQQLTKRYKSLPAVNGITFGIRQGECFGMLGPNGAGKTTTVKMIYCFTPVTEGQLLVFGMDVGKAPRKIKALIGVCPQELNLDPDFTVEKNLQVFARYFGLKPRDYGRRIEDLLAFAELQGKRKERVEALSGGMKRRLQLARALINTPKLLILDEPTTGLDPQARHLIWDRILDLKREGVTIILTTHYMEEAAFLCDRIVVIDHGQVSDTGHPTDLVKRHVGRETLELWEIDAGLEKYIKAHESGFEFSGRRALFSGDNVRDMIDKLQNSYGALTNFLVRPANLEDVFLKLTGRSLRE